MGGIVLEFPGPVFQFCAGGKHFDDQSWRLEKITGPPVTWIACHSDVGMEVAFFGDVDLDVRTIDPAFPPTEQPPQNSLDIGFNRIVVKGPSCHRIYVTVNIFIACVRIVPFQKKVLFYGHGLSMFQCHKLSRFFCDAAHSRHSCHPFLLLYHPLTLAYLWYSSV